MRPVASSDLAARAPSASPAASASPRLAAARAWATGDAAVPLGVLAIATVLGFYLRFMLVARADFPLNDGGLFYLMTRELMEAGFRLPAFTAYNGAEIPFAYPPLGFYVAGLIASATGWPLLDVIRLLPAVLSTLAIPAFYLLARCILRSPLQAAVATVAFAILPRTFSWFVMGGGLTRAPGFLFALLMLRQAYLMFTRGARRDVVLTGVLGSLLVLSHSEITWFAVYTAVLMFLFFGRTRRALVGALAVGAIVVVLSAPWWASVIHHHGTGPFLDAAAGGGYGNFSWFPAKTFLFTDEPFLPILAALGLLGAFASIAEGTLFLPVWLGSIFLINPRNPETPATVPLAMLVAVALCRLIVPRLTAMAGSRTATRPEVRRGVAPPDRPLTSLLRYAAVWLLLAYVAGYAFSGSHSAMRWNSSFRALSPGERSAMAWVAANTPDSSRFLVLDAGAPWFGLDPASEWLPALTGRTSVATVQGYEWLPGRQFYSRIRRYQALHSCATREGVACIERWLTKAPPIDFVYLHDESCCSTLVSSLRASPSYVPVYEQQGTVVFRRTPAVP